MVFQAQWCPHYHGLYTLTWWFFTLYSSPRETLCFRSYVSWWPIGDFFRPWVIVQIHLSSWKSAPYQRSGPGTLLFGNWDPKIIWWIPTLSIKTHSRDSIKSWHGKFKTCCYSYVHCFRLLCPLWQCLGSLVLQKYRWEFAILSIYQAQHMHNPLQTHWQAVKRILRYLQATIDLQFHLSLAPNNKLSTFSDADWGSDKTDRQSVSAYCIFHGNNLISWCSKKQPKVAQSSTEAEYQALAQATCETLWIQSLFTELQI